ncbi:MAG: hypothetical protein V1817_04275 [Candidatus Micrarchaeota archaeon]
MRNLLFSLLLFSSIVGALNLEVSFIPTKPSFHDNESAFMNLTVTNNEVSWASENSTFYYTLNNQTNTISLGDLAAGTTSTKIIDAGKFVAGTYPIDYYLSYNFLLGEQDKTPTQHSSLQILKSKEIVMQIQSLTIQNIVVPQNVVIGQPFTVSFDVNSSVADGIVEISFDGAQNSFSVSEEVKHLSQDFTSRGAGTKTLEIKASRRESGALFLEDFQKRSVLVSNPAEYSLLPSISLTRSEGNVTVGAGETPAETFIKSVSCFIVGGCKGDLAPPKLYGTSARDEGDSRVFFITADDSETGKSKISSCFLRVGADWVNMTPIDGAFDSSVEQATATVLISAVSHDAEFTCLDEFGNSAYASLKKIDCPCGYIDDGKCVKYSCCSDEECGEFQKCDLEIHQCVAKVGCISIVNNGDPSSKANFVFVGAGYSDYESLKSDTLALIDYDGNNGNHGLMSVEPFKSYRNKFNIYILPDNNEISLVKGWFNQLEPDFSKAREVAGRCGLAEYQIIISKTPYRSYASGKATSVSIRGFQDGARTLIHELGHSFGGLADEYVEEELGNRPGQPNCAPNKETAEQWWGDFNGEQDIGFFEGCSYTGKNIRPTFNSIMRNPWELKDGFGLVNTRQIISRLEKYS